MTSVVLGQVGPTHQNPIRKTALWSHAARGVPNLTLPNFKISTNYFQADLSKPVQSPGQDIAVKKAFLHQSRNQSRNSKATYALPHQATTVVSVRLTALYFVMTLLSCCFNMMSLFRRASDQFAFTTPNKCSMRLNWNCMLQVTKFWLLFPTNKVGGTLHVGDQSPPWTTLEVFKLQMLDVKRRSTTRFVNWSLKMRPQWE